MPSARDAEPPEVSQRTLTGRRALAAFWVAWAFWLVLRPVDLSGGTFSAEARIVYATLLFLGLFVLAHMLFRSARWPVTVSRVLVASLIAGAAIGPAGRPDWVWAVDVALALTGSVLAYGVIRQGPPPPPRTGALARYGAARVERRRERLREAYPKHRKRNG